MLVERGAIARLKGDHRYCDWIALVLEEQRQITRFDGT
jgi:hypothetical protein